MDCFRKNCEFIYNHNLSQTLLTGKFAENQEAVKSVCKCIEADVCLHYLIM